MDLCASSINREQGEKRAEGIDDAMHRFLQHGAWSSTCTGIFSYEDPVVPSPVKRRQEKYIVALLCTMYYMYVRVRCAPYKVLSTT